MTLDTRDLCRVAGGRLLVGDHRPIEVVSIDSRTAAPGSAFFCIRGPRFDGHHFAKAAMDAGARVIVADSRGVGAIPADRLDGQVTLVVVGDTVKALGRLAAERRARFAGPVVGLTGSSGKTTTKEMVAAVLRTAGPTLATKGNLNNHLGVPLTLFDLSAEHRFAVIEMGMNAPGEIAYLAGLAGPSIGVVTTVGAAHLAGLGSIEAIAKAKGELLAALPRRGRAIIPSDVTRPWLLTGGLRAPLITVGARPADEVRLIKARPTPEGITGVIEVDEVRHTLRLQLDGRHNLSNAMLAIAAGRELGIDVAAAVAALAEVPPPTMRGEVKSLGDGSTVILDCYNANPQSMQAAIDTFVERAPDGLLVLGDMLELGDDGPGLHEGLGRAVAALDGSVTLVGVGHLSGQLVEAAIDAGLPAARAAWAPDVATATEAVARLRRPGQPILLKGSRGIRLERIYVELAEEGTSP